VKDLEFLDVVQGWHDRLSPAIELQIPPLSTAFMNRDP